MSFRGGWGSARSNYFWHNVFAYFMQALISAIMLGWVCLLIFAIGFSIWSFGWTGLIVAVVSTALAWVCFSIAGKIWWFI